MLRRSGAESLARLQTLSLRGSAKAGGPHQAARGGGQAQGAAHARPRRQRASCTRRSSATASSIPQGAGRHRQVPRREVPLDLTDRTKLATLVESATGTKFVSRFGTGGPRPQRTGAVCSAPQEASFGIFGTAACTLHSLPHVCGWLAALLHYCCMLARTRCTRAAGCISSTGASWRWTS